MSGHNPNLTLLRVTRDPVVIYKTVAFTFGVLFVLLLGFAFYVLWFIRSEEKKRSSKELKKNKEKENTDSDTKTNKPDSLVKKWYETLDEDKRKRAMSLQVQFIDDLPKPKSVIPRRPLIDGELKSDSKNRTKPRKKTKSIDKSRGTTLTSPNNTTSTKSEKNSTPQKNKSKHQKNDKTETNDR